MSSHVMSVAADKAGKIFIHAKGNPAKILAVAVGAAVVFVGVAVGYGVYYKISSNNQKPLK